MKYEPIEFSKLSEAIAYVEDGGELYQLDAGHSYEVSESALVDCWRDRLFIKAKPAPWYEKLDGTVKNGVLCWVDDEKIPDRFRSNVSLITTEAEDGFVDNLPVHWDYATTLTRTEIQKFIDNAPEES